MSLTNPQLQFWNRTLSGGSTRRLPPECHRASKDSSWIVGNPEVTRDRPPKLTVAGASSTCREYLWAASTFQRQGFHRNICAAALKYPLATLLQSVAAAILHHLFQQAPHRFYPVRQTVQFREFFPRQRLPALRGASDIAKTEEQLTDFIQRKTEPPCPLNDCQAIKRCGVVPSLAAHSLGWRKQSDLFVVANRGRLQANLLCHFGNRQLRHGRILMSRHPDSHLEMKRYLQNTACLKVDFKL